jgi:hypothetical protein
MREQLYMMLVAGAQERNELTMSAMWKIATMAEQVWQKCEREARERSETVATGNPTK